MTGVAAAASAAVTLCGGESLNPTIEASGSRPSQRSSGNSDRVSGRSAASSNASIERRHASSCESLSPKIAKTDVEFGEVRLAPDFRQEPHKKNKDGIDLFFYYWPSVSGR